MDATAAVQKVVAEGIAEGHALVVRAAQRKIPVLQQVGLAAIATAGEGGGHCRRPTAGGHAHVACHLGDVGHFVDATAAVQKALPSRLPTHTKYVQASHHVNKSVTGVDQVLHLCFLYLFFGSTALENTTIASLCNTWRKARTFRPNLCVSTPHTDVAGEHVLGGSYWQLILANSAMCTETGIVLLWYKRRSRQVCADR